MLRNSLGKRTIESMQKEKFWLSTKPVIREWIKNFKSKCQKTVERHLQNCEIKIPLSPMVFFFNQLNCHCLNCAGNRLDKKTGNIIHVPFFFMFS